MQPMSRIETTSLTQLHALIADLRWRARLLDSNIREEEQRACASDPASPDYPMLALTLRARRDNLLATIATLENRWKVANPLANSRAA
jgi:hypothetical protein